MAGKRVRCKQCGVVFELPQSANSPDSGNPDLDALAALEKSFSDVDTSSMSGTAAGASPSPRSSARDNDRDAEDGAPPPLRMGRTNVRFRGAYAQEIDEYLPWVLTLGGLAWLAGEMFRNNETNAAWVPIVRFVLSVIAYTVLIAPITIAMIRKAGRKLGYQMPGGVKWRGYSAYLPAFAFGVMMWSLGGGAWVALVLGCVGGVLLATLALWVLFRLRPHEIAPSSGFAATGFFIGLGLAGGIGFLLNMLLVNVMVSLKKPDAIPGSPFGRGFAWIDPKAMESLQPAPKPKPIPKPQPEPEPQQPPVKPEVVAELPKPEATTQAVADSQPTETVEPEPKPQVTKPAIAAASDAVRAATAVDVKGSFDDLALPLTESSFIGVVRRGGSNPTVEVWNTSTDPWARVNVPPFVGAANSLTQYALSPSGKYLAYISEFPKKQITIWNFKDAMVMKSLDLDDKRGSPELLGFASDTRVMIRWPNAPCSIDVFDITAAKRLPIDTPVVDRGGTAVAVSADGQMIAVATKESYRNAGEVDLPTLNVYNLNTGRLLWHCKITALDKKWAVAPTGMAFSKDSKKLAALFEQNGSGLLVSYRLDRGGPVVAPAVKEQPLPAGPLPGKDLHGFIGNTLDWMPDGVTCVLYGRGLFNTTTGQLTLDLNLTGAIKTCRVLGPDTLEVVGDSASSEKQITLLKLDMGKVSVNPGQ
ncbi:MAG TPA: hypothetical protein VH518_12970 [Tepidisphaeraceae bacterium]|jgi:WD40 repeat protein